MSQALLIFICLVGGCKTALSCNVSVREVLERSVRLSWKECDANPLSISYHGRAHCGDEIPSNSTAELPNLCEYTIKDLQEFTNYTFNLIKQSGETLSTATSAYTRAAAPTGPPQNLTAKSVSTDTVELTWRREKCLDRNGVITGYVIQYTREYWNITVHDKRVQVITSHAISSLSPNTTYQFQVATENTNGTGPFSDVVVTTLTEGTTSSSSSVAAGAAAGGILLIVLVTAVVLPIVMRRRRRYRENVKEGLPLQQNTVSSWPSAATEKEYEEGSQPDGAEYATISDITYQKAPVYDNPSEVNSEVTRAKQPQATRRAMIENQHYLARENVAPTIGSYEEELQVLEGKQVTLMVTASGFPQPTITWAYQGKEVEADYATELGEDGSLTLVCVEPKHGGIYHFTASNKAGNAEGDVTLIIYTDLEEEQGNGDGGLAMVDSSPMETETFGECVSRLHACNNAGFILQYQSLPSGEVGKYMAVGTSPDNRPKNRFEDITVYDSNRITLEPTPNIEHGYINASNIDGFLKPKKYIATQGPLPNTVVDFWRLVWQEKVQAIAMLTNVMEGVQRKCEQYWPEARQSEMYGPFEVTVVDQKVFADCTIRTLQLEQSGMVGVRKKVTQFHFTSWPDHGVPEYAGPLLAYQHRIKAKYRPSKGPLLVHCSAGVGRTGTLIAIDIALEQAAKDGTVDIAGIVSKMRGQRMKMVQTEEQYIFIHDAILESLVCGDTHISSSELREVIERLNGNDELTGKSGFEKQFHVLDQVTPNPNEVVRSAALKHQEKNRDTHFLPPDKWRVTVKSETSDYIHASYANGYKQSKRFIIAQAPMKSTVCDFWKMVYERECGVIVMLSDLIKDQKVCFPYWPKVDKKNAQKYGQYAISTVETFQHNGYSQRVFNITDQQSGKVRKVTQFQMTGWTPEGVCINPKAFLDLIEQVTTEQMRTNNMPIVVHGTDTVSRSGIFCALMNAMECCKTEGTVDVFQVVKALRIQKPGAVPTVEQYCFIFDLMLLFLETFDIYSNFK